MKKLALLCAPLLAIAATPAQAADIGTFAAAGFSYGTLSGGTFNPYPLYPASASECLGIGDCARGGDKYAIIAATSTPGQLLVHPGPGFGGNSAVAYTTAMSGLFSLNALASSADSGAKTVGYFTIISGLLTAIPSGSISGSSSQSIATTIQLGVGDRLGVFVNNGNGDYYNDSTLVSGSITAATGAVPEPATWGLMILGFGLAGYGIRRRKVAAKVRFA